MTNLHFVESSQNILKDPSVQFEIFYNSNDFDVLGQALKLINELKDYRITKVDNEGTKEFQLRHSRIFIVRFAWRPSKVYILYKFSALWEMLEMLSSMVSNM